MNGGKKREFWVNSIHNAWYQEKKRRDAQGRDEEVYSEAVADELDNIVGIGFGGPAHDEAITNVDDLAVVVAVDVRLGVVQDSHLKCFEWAIEGGVES